MGTESNGKIKPEIVEYIEKTPLAVLATVKSDGTPVVRTMGAFAQTNGGTTVYFVTVPQAEKTRQIEGNNKVSFLFQQEGQQLAEFRNVALIGKAAKVTADPELNLAAKLISARSPYVKERIEKEGLAIFSVYKVIASEVKFLDYRKGIGPQAIETISL